MAVTVSCLEFQLIYRSLMPYMALALLPACAGRTEDTGRAATDTVVTTRQEVDTTLIRTDTNITVDTTRIKGEDSSGAIMVDTASN